MEGLWASVDTRSSEGYCYTAGVIGVCEMDYVVCLSQVHVCRVATNYKLRKCVLINRTRLTENHS